MLQTPKQGRRTGNPSRTGAGTSPRPIDLAIRPLFEKELEGGQIQLALERVQPTGPMNGEIEIRRAAKPSR